MSPFLLNGLFSYLKTERCFWKVPDHAGGRLSNVPVFNHFFSNAVFPAFSGSDRPE